MTQTNLQLGSLITADNTVELSLSDTAIPEPAADEVVVRVEAAPLNPSDLAIHGGDGLRILSDGIVQGREVQVGVLGVC